METHPHLDIHSLLHRDNVMKGNLNITVFESFTHTYKVKGVYTGFTTSVCLSVRQSVHQSVQVVHYHTLTQKPLDMRTGNFTQVLLNPWLGQYSF